MSLSGTLIAREAGCHIEMLDQRRCPPGNQKKPAHSGAYFDLFSRSCVAAASPALAMRLKVMAHDAIKGKQYYEMKV